MYQSKQQISSGDADVLQDISFLAKHWKILIPPMILFAFNIGLFYAGYKGLNQRVTNNEAAIATTNQSVNTIQVSLENISVNIQYIREILSELKQTR